MTVKVFSEGGNIFVNYGNDLYKLKMRNSAGKEVKAIGDVQEKQLRQATQAIFEAMRNPAEVVFVRQKEKYILERIPRTMEFKKGINFPSASQVPSDSPIIMDMPDQVKSVILAFEKVMTSEHKRPSGGVPTAITTSPERLGNTYRIAFEKVDSAVEDLPAPTKMAPQRSPIRPPALPTTSAPKPPVASLAAQIKKLDPAGQNSVRKAVNNAATATVRRSRELEKEAKHLGEIARAAPARVSVAKVAEKARRLSGEIGAEAQKALDAKNASTSMKRLDKARHHSFRLTTFLEETPDVGPEDTLIALDELVSSANDNAKQVVDEWDEIMKMIQF